MLRKVFDDEFLVWASREPTRTAITYKMICALNQTADCGCPICRLILSLSQIPAGDHEPYQGSNDAHPYLAHA